MRGTSVGCRSIVHLLFYSSCLSVRLALGRLELVLHQLCCLCFVVVKEVPLSFGSRVITCKYYDACFKSLLVSNHVVSKKKSRKKKNRKKNNRFLRLDFALMEKSLP